MTDHKTAYYRWSGLRVTKINIPSWYWSTMENDWLPCDQLMKGDIFTFSLPSKPLGLADAIYLIDQTTTFSSESVSKLWVKHKFGIVSHIPACSGRQVYVDFIPET